MNKKTSYQKNVLAVIISIIISFSLGSIKAISGILFHSLALLASAFDSFLDAGSSFMNLITIRAASKPPDEEHSFGHGKFEAFAEFVQGIIIGVSGIFLIEQSFVRFFSPVSIEHEWVILVVMFFSFLLTLFLVLFLRNVFLKTGSLVIKSDLAHYFSDLLSGGAVLGGLVIMSITGKQFIDPLLSLGIACIILFSSVQLLRESFLILTDHELPKSMRKQIENVLQSTQYPVTGWHFLRTRRSGTHFHIDYHLVFHAKISLEEAHNHSEEIEQKIRNIFPHSIILTHLDPSDDSEKNKQEIPL
jgi:cation diffusion facilitator family transporter